MWRVGFEMELEGGRVICLGKRQRNSCDETEHTAWAHPTVGEDIVTSHGKQNDAGGDMM